MQDDPIVVIGAGVIGTMTARALAKRGRRVTVIERLPGPAQLCSRGNAGIMAVGHAKAWAEPAAIPALGQALLGRAPGIRVTRLMDPALWRWGVEFLRHCTTAANKVNTDKERRLSRYSRDMLQAAEAEMGLPAATWHAGALYLFQDAAQFRNYAAKVGAGAEITALSRDDLIAREPGLAAMRDRLAGGLLSRIDSVGDCHLFTGRTAAWAAENGVEFRYDTDVTGFARANGRITAVQTDAGPIACAGVVLATGVETPDLTRPLGFAPAIYPVKGYSGTWRITDPAGVPKLPFVDETELLAVANYGDRLRVTAIAEFAGRDRSLPADRVKLLDAYVRRSFGAAVDLDHPEFWTGLRPTTPAGPPYLGRVRRFENLWINAGHGQLGWTMSLGAAETLAQAMAGEPPALRDVSSRARWLEAL
ncbi:FAD-dependent oxidoreductase [Paenirhodobacter sp. CAU 1674]|uniref:FAD-dependent oxidoreductase n=1 Tax=Paenirhodobacter sp. CAU 1674 TaxID=3032596 RepID=UPI0023DCA3B4|nr:FAD-dependent oxidoreductase [Paenirhodobacter sp. CAU 1674]MDF2140903.1 FAD-dependent oxidoreductase [Paenirhodobacter sp. CAU 1674]